MTTTRGIAWAVLAFLLFLAPRDARAHGIVDEGIAAADDGRFEDALAAFDRAWHATDLSREDLVSLLVRRAIVHGALRAREDLDTDLRMLVTLDPLHQLEPIVPPQIRRRFEQIRTEPRETPSVSVEVGFTASAATFDVTVTGLPDALVSRVRVFGRAQRGSFQSAEGTHVELPLASARAVEWYVEVHGPGGAVLLSEGAQDAPRSTPNPLSVSVASSLAAPASPEEDRPSRSAVWWAVGGGAAAAVILTTVIVVVVRDPQASTYVTDPVFR